MSLYHILDEPRILRNAFFPRRMVSRPPDNAFDLQVAVEADVSIHCRFYTEKPEFPSILYFHGNGEIVSDYDGFAHLFNAAGANLVVADYRGYGDSTGTPAFATMIEDAHRICAAVKEELARRKFSSDLYIMGRSLGSVSALELAAADNGECKGLIIESGFVCASRIARRLGVSPEKLEPLEAECRQKIQRIRLPALVIHGEEDNLVPMTEAEAIYGLLETEKKLLIIPYADHNTLFFEGEEEYFEAVRNFIK
ncbi:MAG: alpha/beta hydrolase [Firmicutes bacterium]|nr:alpha/beta hydrolase [Bacillota bacterium]